MANQKTDWRLYERDLICPQSISAYLDLIYLKQSKKYPYLANHYEVLTFENGYLWWARDAKAIKKTAKKWINGWLASEIKFNEFLKLFKNLETKTKNILPPLKNVKLKSITDQKLYSLYEQIKNIFLSNIVFNEYGVDLFDDFFDQVFAEKLKKITKNKIGQTELTKLLTPAETTESLNYQKKILEISIAKNYSAKTLGQLAKKFSWIAMGWDGSNELNSAQVKKDLVKLKKINLRERQKKLKEINDFSKKVKTERNKILKEYKISPKELKPYFYLLDTFVVLHDQRKESQMRCNQIIFPVLLQMAKRFKISYSDLLFYFNADIKNLCLKKQKLSQSLIKERKKGITWVIKNGQVQEFIGPQAKKVLAKLVLANFKSNHTSEVTGQVASLGKITGIAFVTKSGKEAVKFIKKGEILITTMTTVDFLPAMRLAGAVVTDDGGVTCHAAIVSRELGIPCIVGTKFATKVFKTKDKVEVDANKGVIRKIR
ncbi:MAG: PEP-utilizing enzyme [Candidatus Buchananbacteria bacterium]